MHVQAIIDLCHGKPDLLAPQPRQRTRILAFHVAVIFLGSGLYGATIGLWRAPLQGLFAAVKFPLVILLTTLANGLLNGMLAQLLGLRLSLRDTLLAVLASFSIASVILASLSPVALFILLNTPPLGTGNNLPAHSFTLLTHVAFIAFAGVMGNIRLYGFLLQRCGSKAVAWKGLLAWLIGNMFLGCQLSWVLRPFIGAPHLPVEFLRAEAFQGNFYESVWLSLLNILG